MINSAEARRRMLDTQIRPYDITERHLMAAMIELPRERFLPPAAAPFAYYDLDVELREGAQCRRLLRPAVLARLIQAVDLQRDDRVLDVGCATGYSTALLARLSHAVVGLEEDVELAACASTTLADLGFDNTCVVTAPLTRGHPAGAPYNVIVVEGACEVIPPELFEQLAEGGRLIAIMGQQPGKATTYRCSSGRISSRPVFEAGAAWLPGFNQPPGFVF